MIVLQSVWSVAISIFPLLKTVPIETPARFCAAGVTTLAERSDATETSVRTFAMSDPTWGRFSATLQSGLEVSSVIAEERAEIFSALDERAAVSPPARLLENVEVSATSEPASAATVLALW